jgi:pimeloyl-ACP methyl ester carboxylesterase
MGASGLVNDVLAWLWQRPLLAQAVASAHRRLIECESACRQAFNRQGRAGPAVNWHEGGSGEPLLLLNGFTASGLAWPTAWLRRLERRYRVIRVDNRGTGWSRDAPAPFTLADMADDARDVLDALGLDRAVVFGMSMGGMIAQEFAIRHAACVERLVLAATIPPIPAQVPTALGLALSATLFKPTAGDISEPTRDQAAEVARGWLRFAGESFIPGNDVIAEMGHQALTRVTPLRGVFMQARALNAWSGPKRLRRISAPTTVLHGEVDRVVPIENGRRLARLIPGAQLVPLPGVGHLVPWEAEDALVRILGAE